MKNLSRFSRICKLFILLFWCHRLGKHSGNGSEGLKLALVLRAGHPRKQIAITSLVNRTADSKDRWLLTITDDHLAKSGRRTLDCHSTKLTHDQALERFCGRLHEAGCSTTAKKKKLHFMEGICHDTLYNCYKLLLSIFLSLCRHKTSKLRQNFAFLSLFIQFNVLSKFSWVVVSCLSI